MNGPADRAGYEGLSQVAHAIRRSYALSVAVQLCPPESSEAEVLACADRLAVWIRGGAQEHQQAEQPLGQPWSPVQPGF